MVERIADSRGLTTSDFIRATLGLEPEEDARLVDPSRRDPRGAQLEVDAVSSGAVRRRASDEIDKRESDHLRI